ncbi:hypothetical protein [Caulobacter sp. LARHSG274]
MRSFEHEIDGHKYRATWKLSDYDRLIVDSPYGSTYAYVDGREPAELARSLLVQLVRQANWRRA